MAIKKRRTTGLTTGEIQQVDVTPPYNTGRTNRPLHDQLLAGAMSQGGDSGSAVLDTQNRLIGLLFAAAKTARSSTDRTRFLGLG